jgi:hypothetical protein
MKEKILIHSVEGIGIHSFKTCAFFDGNGGMLLSRQAEMQHYDNNQNEVQQFDNVASRKCV